MLIAVAQHSTLPYIHYILLVFVDLLIVREDHNDNYKKKVAMRIVSITIENQLQNLLNDKIIRLPLQPPTKKKRIFTQPEFGILGRDSDVTFF